LGRPPVPRRRHRDQRTVEDRDDLGADDLRRVADRLEIAVPEQSWPSLVEAATFASMRAEPDMMEWLHR